MVEGGSICLFRSVDARYVYHNIDHVATQLVALHVNRRRVSGDVDLGYHVEKEGLFNARVLFISQNVRDISRWSGKALVTETNILSKFSNVGSCGINFCTTLLNASKIL